MIVLVGFMGAGKSTVGRELAAREGLPFVDSDAVLVERLGCSIADYFAAHGEVAFREVERDIVLELLGGSDSVLALGGGSLTTPEVRDALEGHQVVHLDVELPEALRRAGDPQTRPMLRRPDLPDLFQARRPVYAAACDLVVPTTGRSSAEVVEEVARSLVRVSRPLVVLTGPPGAGKSAVGQAVAELLGVACVESDAELERLAGMPAADVYVDLGEERFRELEREAALAVLDRAGVVALGGGSVLHEEVRTVLADRRVVFLDVGIADAARRIGFDQSPSMVALLPRRSWIKHMEARRPLYAATSTWTVETAGRSVQDLADQVVELVQGGSA